MIKKAVIPVAGLGTRFLPVTKSLPKELLPIGTKPTLHMVIDEAVSSGLTEIIFVNSPQKKLIEDYFSLDTAYDMELEKKHKGGLLAELKTLLQKIFITSVPQREPKGLGHAILCAKEAVGDEPFVVILPDVLIESEVPCSRQLIEAYEKTGSSVNATEHTSREKLSLYGIYDIAKSEGKFHWARSVIEKPEASKAPSDFSVVGRYLFTPDVFEILENTPPGKNGEIQLADAMNTLAKSGRMIAYEYEGRQFDTGDEEGFIKANLYYGLKKYPNEIGAYIKQLCK